MANLAPAPTALLGLLVGILIGTLHTRNARRYWQWRLGRKLQLITARNEMKGYRHKRKRPMLKRWQKFLLGWLHSRSPTFTRYTNFRPETLVGWHSKSGMPTPLTKHRKRC